MADVTDAHGQELTNSGGGKTLYTGGKFTPNENIYLISALKNTYCDADTAYLLNAAMEVIDSQAFVGDIATFTNSNLLTNGTEYSLAIKNSDDGEFTYRAGAAAAGVPIAKTNITYTHGIDAGGEATYFVNLVSITTNVDDTEYIGIIATSEQIDLMCGENVNTIGNKNSNKNDLMAQVQAYLSNLVKYDIATNWASLNSVYRQLFSEYAARYCAIQLINYNTSSYTSKIETEDMISVHKYRMDKIKNILSDSSIQDLIKI